MFASAEVAIGFLLVFMLLSVAALIGTVALVVKCVFSVFRFTIRRLLGLPIGPAPRYPGRRQQSFNPHSGRLSECEHPPRYPATRPGQGGASVGPRVYCTHDRCGHENRVQARYCARCGRPIRPQA